MQQISKFLIFHRRYKRYVTTCPFPFASSQLVDQASVRSKSAILQRFKTALLLIEPNSVIMSCHWIHQNSIHRRVGKAIVLQGQVHCSSSQPSSQKFGLADPNINRTEIGLTILLNIFCIFSIVSPLLTFFSGRINDNHNTKRN